MIRGTALVEAAFHRRTDRPLRVALVIGRFPSLTQTFILNQITGLIDRGHDVDIYAWKGEPGANHPAAIARYDLLSRTRYWPAGPEGFAARSRDAIRLLARGFAKSPHRTLASLNFLRYGRQAASLTLLR